LSTILTPAFKELKLILQSGYEFLTRQVGKPFSPDF